MLKAKSRVYNMHSGYQLSIIIISLPKPDKKSEPIPDPTHLIYGISFSFVLCSVSSRFCLLSAFTAGCLSLQTSGKHWI